MPFYFSWCIFTGDWRSRDMYFKVGRDWVGTWEAVNSNDAKATDHCLFASSQPSPTNNSNSSLSITHQASLIWKSLPPLIYLPTNATITEPRTNRNRHDGVNKQQEQAAKRCEAQPIPCSSLGLGGSPVSAMTRSRHQRARKQILLTSNLETLCTKYITN